MQPSQTLSSDSPLGPVQPVSGCGHVKTGSGAQELVSAMSAFPSEFAEEAVPTCPHRGLKEPGAPSPHPPQLHLGALSPFTLTPACLHSKGC